jgi:hypothetical protein
MKKLFFIILFINLTINLFSQVTIYGGYKAGKYTFREAPVENLCTKFNLGWDFIKSEDNCLISFDPGSSNYQIDDYMNRINLPHGLELGMIGSIFENFGFQVGLNFLNQNTSGKRVNLMNGFTEELSLKTHYGGFTINFIFQKYKIQPFLGFDLGSTNMSYSYSNGIDEITNQKVGYDVKLLNSKVVPGDNELTTSINIGAFFNILKKDNFTIKISPNYQWRMLGNTEINQGNYYSYLFRHSNFTLSFWLAYEI